MSRPGRSATIRPFWSGLDGAGILKILVVLAHPDPGSFNHALAHSVRDALLATGHDVRLRDLYAERFDPVLPAEEVASECELPAEIDGYCEELADAEGIVIVHPNWWGQPPAILKGWIDRVVRPGVAYRFLEGDSGEGRPQGLLRARRALVLNTANTPAERERTVFGDPLSRIWTDCVFGLCGVHEVRRRTFSLVVTSTPEERAAWLEEAALLAVDCFGETDRRPTPGPMITTARLVLAPLNLEDAPRLFAYRSDPGVSRFQFFDPRTVDDAQAFIRDAAVSGWCQLGIRVEAGSVLAGDIGFRLSGDHPLQAEIGVTLAPDHQGRGLASEALGALLDYLFAELGVHRVFASIDPRNATSLALFERAGMRREGHHRQSVWFKGEWADDEVFALLESEWQKR
jgi:NAD(P)H dehydrogenase (quinone)